jgi:ATP synthase protein I
MLFGLIAWSVVVPTLLLVAVGLFIDECTVGHFSWTMLMVIVGVVVGSVNVLLWLHGRHPHVARGIHH